MVKLPRDRGNGVLLAVVDNDDCEEWAADNALAAAFPGVITDMISGALSARHMTL